MGLVVCGGCSNRLPPDLWNTGMPVPCPFCSRDVEVMIFAAAARPPQSHLPERIVAAGEASCFYHSMNRAAAACDACGRFLCALCDLPIDGTHVCPSCLESGSVESVRSTVVRERVNYDSIALALATLPMLLCSLILFTTPIALFLAFRFWNQPSPVLERGRWRLWLTVAVAALQVLAIAGFIIYVVRSAP